MSDVVSRIVSFGSRVTNGLRLPWPPHASVDPPRANFRQTELDGPQFAFYARLTAILSVSTWLFWIVPWPRDLYYGGYALGLLS
jgi:adenylate cyclase